MPFAEPAIIVSITVSPSSSSTRKELTIPNRLTREKPIAADPTARVAPARGVQSPRRWGGPTFRSCAASTGARSRACASRATSFACATRVSSSGPISRPRAAPRPPRWPRPSGSPRPPRRPCSTSPSAARPARRIHVEEELIVFACLVRGHSGARVARGRRQPRPLPGQRLPARRLPAHRARARVRPPHGCRAGRDPGRSGRALRRLRRPPGDGRDPGRGPRRGRARDRRDRVEPARHGRPRDRSRRPGA